MTRTKTRGTLPLASLDTLIDQVGVSRELVRSAIDPNYGNLSAVSPESLARARRDLQLAHQKLLGALDTLRAMRYDA